ncbi:MAG: POTRA domain-containing protein, partial [Verrucomicrobiota bacterium]
AIKPNNGTYTAGARPAIGSLYIREYRVDGGSNLLPRIQIEEAVYPYLGPGRTENDVESARTALEKAFRDKGFQTVAVQIPQQQVRGGVVLLQVVEGKVGRLRVKGSRYFLPSDIKKGAPSLAEGKVPDFNEVQNDIVALNQNPDRRVTPVLRAGLLPGTVDIDLNVKDSLPLHASLELNNRYSIGTTVLRLNGSLGYNNLWQMGHKIGVSFQLAPERLTDGEVFSGFYVAPIPNVNWLSLMVQGTKQNSNVSTLGGPAVAGNGITMGGRALITLPSGNNYFESLSTGLDYKHYYQNVVFGDITYYPFCANYNLTVTGSGSVTELNAGVNFSLRGVSGNQQKFQRRGTQGDASYIYLRGDLSRTQDLPGGFQLFAKMQGQISSQPLLDSEQFSGGGLSTTRGYLEATQLGDDALFGTLELRTPSLGGWLKINDWRFFTFTDAGLLTFVDPLPQTQARFNLASVGVGSRMQILDHLNGEIDVGIPLINQYLTGVPTYLVTFRVWADF